MAVGFLKTSPCITVSSGIKSVVSKGMKQDVEDHQERLYCSGITGTQNYTSGTHNREVIMGEENEWAIESVRFPESSLLSDANLGTFARMFTPDLPLEIPDFYCKKHQKPLQLFCADDQLTLCDKCTLEHKDHMMYGVEEAAENYRKLCQAVQNELRKKLEITKSILSDDQERVVMVQKDEHNFKEMIESEYRIRFRLLKEENKVNDLRPPGCLFGLKMKETNLHQPVRFATELEEQFQEILQKLRDLTRENMNKLQQNEVWLSEQICSLQGLISELEKMCNEPALPLLQSGD
ncbi:PREDICTED: probable E3 ubiquitin-protein ligase TRIML2-like [Elephantulus edwardii]|uniref:probable E3 ubiquitin-protein ligase TRIML2-like n=1 Tax=Elephantulus edwardii TaxID=28737 RepID=UPI0003F05CBF|nr:PREDICTED: probable E3 ubiquitin-protein ligase TRIML2-like [Elephantulus edwardii]